MMQQRRLLILCLALLGLPLASCADRPDRLLLGKWQAVSATAAGDSLALDPAEVGFVFTPNNRYTYRSTLRHAEAGTFRYVPGYLFATDTTRAGEERVVAIDKLTEDSLVIRMKADTTFKVLTFLRD